MSLTRRSAGRRPSHLVVIDGTWSHARTVFRDLPWLRRLPRYGLEPSEPGRYRIRREPRAECLSTIEAIVHALRTLEPETQRLDELLGAFEAMIDDQIRHLRAHGAGGRSRTRRPRRCRAIPRILSRELERIVVVYGESSASVTGRGNPPRELVQWCAVRPTSGAVFHRLVKPERFFPAERHCAHMGLRREDLEAARGVDALRADFASFLRDDDVLAAWNRSSLDLASQAGFDFPSLVLKGAYSNSVRRRPGTLEDVITREGLHTEGLDVPGRASIRLAHAAALARWLSVRGRGG